MDINQDEIQSLFADDRGENDIGEFHVGIDIRAEGVCIYTEDEQFVLSEAEKEELIDHIDGDSIWDVLSETVKSLRYLR